MTEAYDICGVTVNVPMQFWKINVFDRAELQSIYQISHFPEWLSCPQGSLMATFWDQNLNREVLIKENPLKKIDLDYQNQHRLKIPFMTSRKRNVSAQCETSVVLKREHTLSFASGKCTRTIENTSFPVDQCCESAYRELNIIGTRKSNCLILMKASEICSASSILSLNNIRAKRNIMLK